MKLSFVSVFALFLLISCGSSPEAGWPETNLIEHGVPITIKAPEGLEVSKKALGFQQDITLTKGTDYLLQIFVSDAIVSNQEDALKAQKELVEDNPYFQKLVVDEPAGFIFENQVDSSYATYGFRYVKLMGGKEYIFQEGLLGSTDLDAVKSMYAGVKFSEK